MSIGIDFQTRQVVKWYLAPGASEVRRDVLQKLKQCFLRCNEVKIATAFLSNTTNREIFEGELGAAIGNAFDKITLFQIDVDPRITVPCARFLVEELGERLRVVTAGSSYSRNTASVHHKQFLFIFDDHILVFEGSMNLTRNGLNENGETLIATRFGIQGEDEKAANALFSLYENQKYIVSGSNGYEGWIKYIEELDDLRSREKDASKNKKVIPPGTQLDLSRRTIQTWFSTIGPVRSYSDFISNLQSVEERVPGVIQSRRNASECLSDIYRRLPNMDLEDAGNQEEFRRLLSKVKYGPNGQDCRELGAIQFSSMKQPMEGSIDILERYRDYVLAIGEGEKDVVAKFKKVSLSGADKAKPSMGFYSRIATIARPEECFTYNGPAKPGIDMILECLGFGFGNKIVEGDKVTFENYHRACDHLKSAEFLVPTVRDDEFKFVDSAVMHYLDVQLYNLY